MKASFPTEFDAVLLGKSREGGSFENSDGVEVSYGDAYEFAFDSSDGLAQTCRIPVKQLDQAADFDVEMVPRYSPVRIVGDVNVTDRGGFLRPTTVRQAKASSGSSS